MDYPVFVRSDVTRHAPRKTRKTMVLSIYEDLLVKCRMQKIQTAEVERFPSPSASLGASPRPDRRVCELSVERFSEPEVKQGFRRTGLCDRVGLTRL